MSVIVEDVLYLVVSASSAIFFGLVAAGVLSSSNVSSALTILTVLGFMAAYYKRSQGRPAGGNGLSRNSKTFTLLLSLVVAMVFVVVLVYRISKPNFYDLHRDVAYLLAVAFVGMSGYYIVKMSKSSIR